MSAELTFSGLTLETFMIFQCPIMWPGTICSVITVQPAGGERLGIVVSFLPLAWRSAGFAALIVYGSWFETVFAIN